MKMRAVVISQPGGVEVLSLSERTIAEPGPGQVLCQVAASALNRADLLQRRGHYPAPPGSPKDIPGLEFAGTVAAVGADVTRFKVGDQVMAIVGGGGMAERILVHESELLPVPKNLSLAEAAAIPEAFLTAYDALILQAGLGAGQILLIHAVASGVGTAAIELAQTIGATSIGTLRSRDKLDRCKALGLDHGIVVENGQFAEAVHGLTGGRGVDVIFDMVGGAYMPENFKVAATSARIHVIGTMGGPTAEIALPLLLTRRLTLSGSTLRSRPLEEKAILAQKARRLVPLFESGKLRPVIDEILPMDRIREAHERMESNKTFGKLVLTW
jgi:putative PIG3 family NAD(P)H quinone oxidoreductase